MAIKHTYILIALLIVLLGVVYILNKGSFSEGFITATDTVIVPFAIYSYNPTPSNGVINGYGWIVDTSYTQSNIFTKFKTDTGVDFPSKTTPSLALATTSDITYYNANGGSLTSLNAINITTVNNQNSIPKTPGTGVFYMKLTYSEYNRLLQASTDKANSPITSIIKLLDIQHPSNTYVNYALYQIGPIVQLVPQTTPSSSSSGSPIVTTTPSSSSSGRPIVTTTPSSSSSSPSITAPYGSTYNSITSLPADTSDKEVYFVDANPQRSDMSGNATRIAAALNATVATAEQVKQWYDQGGRLYRAGSVSNSTYMYYSGNDTARNFIATIYDSTWNPSIILYGFKPASRTIPANTFSNISFGLTINPFRQANTTTPEQYYKKTTATDGDIFANNNRFNILPTNIGSSSSSSAAPVPTSVPLTSTPSSSSSARPPAPPGSSSSSAAPVPTSVPPTSTPSSSSSSLLPAPLGSSSSSALLPAPPGSSSSSALLPAPLGSSSSSALLPALSAPGPSEQPIVPEFGSSSSSFSAISQQDNSLSPNIGMPSSSSSSFASTLNASLTGGWDALFQGLGLSSPTASQAQSCNATTNGRKPAKITDQAPTTPDLPPQAPPLNMTFLLSTVAAFTTSSMSNDESSVMTAFIRKYGAIKRLPADDNDSILLIYTQYPNFYNNFYGILDENNKRVFRTANFDIQARLINSINQFNRDTMIALHYALDPNFVVEDVSDAAAAADAGAAEVDPSAAYSSIKPRILKDIEDAIKAQMQSLSAKCTSNTNNSGGGTPGAPGTPGGLGLPGAPGTPGPVTDAGSGTIPSYKPTSTSSSLPVVIPQTSSLDSRKPSSSSSSMKPLGPGGTQQKCQSSPSSCPNCCGGGCNVCGGTGSPSLGQGSDWKYMVLPSNSAAKCGGEPKKQPSLIWGE